MRVNRCKEILTKAIHMKKSLEKFVGDATRLTDKLLELCNKSVLSLILVLISQCEIVLHRSLSMIWVICFIKVFKYISIFIAKYIKCYILNIYLCIFSPPDPFS